MGIIAVDVKSLQLDQHARAVGLVVLAAMVVAFDLVGNAFAMVLLWFALAVATVAVRRARATAALADIFEISLFYETLLLLVALLNVQQVVPKPFPQMLIAVGLVVFNHLRRGRSWGEMTLNWPRTWRAWTLTIPFALLSIGGLAAWYFLVAERPHPLGEMLPHWRTSILLGAVPVIAVANAIREEFLARVIWQSEARRIAGVWPAIVFQAAVFGLMHYRGGFPNGWIGVALTFTFGFVMGVLTHRTRSVWPAVVVHTLCDAFIVGLVVLERDGMSAA